MGRSQDLKARGLAKRGGVGRYWQERPLSYSTAWHKWVKAYETVLEYDVRPKASKSQLS